MTVPSLTSAPSAGVPEHAIEVVDGLMLGGARLEGTPPKLDVMVARRYRTWGALIIDDLQKLDVDMTTTPLITQLRLRGTGAVLGVLAPRWARGLPSDVRLTPQALAHWFASSGTLVSNGYVVRLTLRGRRQEEAKLVVDRLRELYGWEAMTHRDRHSMTVRLARNGDRLELRRLITGLVPPCFAAKLALKESAPCTPEEAARRRHPQRLTPEQVADVRARIMQGEAYDAIATAVGVSRQHVGRIARKEAWRDPGSSIIRQRKLIRRLTPADAQVILERVAKGEPQRAVAADFAVPQSSISRLLARVRR